MIQAGVTGVGWNGAVILDGSGPADVRTQTAVFALREALDQAGIRHETYVARDLDVDPCTGCFGCWIRKPGECVFEGPTQQIVRLAVAADMLVIATPVTFGGYSYEIKKVLDRIVCSLLLPFFKRVDGEIHHPARYAKLPELVVMGTLPASDADAEAVFVTLVARNARNLHSKRTAVAVVSGDLNSAEFADAATSLLARAGVESTDVGRLRVVGLREVA